MSTNALCVLGLVLVFLASGFVETSPVIALFFLAPLAWVCGVIVRRAL